DLEVFKKEIHVLALLNNVFSGGDVIVARMASLPVVREEVLPEELQEVGADTENDFVDELINESKTFHTGALIRRIWSGLNIPHQSTIPSGQPLGGVSDITNKGDFDRLLLSEFANDDVLFMSRLANNEALYINREIPPENNNLKRVILLDTSIKNWGNQRCVSHALAIAITKHPKTKFECDVFATGYGWSKLNYTTTADVIDSLAFLDGCLHTAQGLEDFLQNGLENKNVELFFVSSKDAAAYAPVQLVLNKYNDLFKYWIYTNDEGAVELYRKQGKSKKLMQTFRLPLEELWSKPPKQKKHEEKEEDGGLGKYPVLFPKAQSVKRTLCLPNGEQYNITSERSLLRFYDSNMKPHEKGWELVYENLPGNCTEMEIGAMENGDRVMLLFSPQRSELIYLNLTTGKQYSKLFTEWTPRSWRNFIFYHDCFYYQLREYYFSIDVNDEKIVIEKINETAPNFLNELYDAREKRVKEAPQYGQTGGVLKNINDIFINEVNNLVLNGHELRLTNYKAIRFEQNKFTNVKQRAEVGQAYKYFTFNDGSIIRINRAGIVILESSNADIPPIYIPTRLDTILGVATETEFAGHVYYYRSNASNKQTVISEINFVKKYIDGFINHINTHATKH
ncbi:MAG TPA: hypothetical protein VK177_17630, partial [Flavobacteriales bacterium]|nr:hypothetical protein [Flavobacteriales bacterium]